MILNIDDIYHDYLLKVGEEERNKIKKMPGFFGMSGAGSCFLKQMFKAEKYEAIPHDKRTTRMFRLGTLVHNDIEKAIKQSNIQELENIEIEIEQHFIIGEYKIRGYADIIITDHINKLIEVIDIKTVKSYAWKFMYGHVKNRDTNPAVMAELQVASYAISKLKNNIGYTVKMYLYHYKKDDSITRIKQLPDTFLHSALMYWTEFKEFRSENTIKDIEPGITFNVPVYQWECKFCQYTNHCNSPYKK